MRQALPSSPTVADNGHNLASKHSSNGNSPTAHRRKPSFDTQSPRPSPKASQVSPNNAHSTGDTNGCGADSRGAFGDGNEEHGCEDDWIVLGDAALRARDVDRPLSPGVDLMGAKGGGGGGGREEAVATEEDRGDKWLDAGNIHNFLVRGATYLTVRIFLLCMFL